MWLLYVFLKRLYGMNEYLNVFFLWELCVCRFILRVWEIVGVRYEDLKLVKMIVLKLFFIGGDVEILFEYFNCWISNGNNNLFLGLVFYK